MSNSLQQTYQIREMRLEDVRRVILIEREIFLFPWSEMNFADSIRAGYYCRVVELNDFLIGYAIMLTGPDEAHILTIGISAQWQHQGLVIQRTAHIQPCAARTDSRSYGRPAGQHQFFFRDQFKWS